MPVDAGPGAPPLPAQINAVLRALLVAAVIGAGAMMWSLVAGLARLEGEIAAMRSALSGEIEELRLQVRDGMADRYRGADAGRDLALRDRRLDRHEHRIERVEGALRADPRPEREKGATP